MDNEEHGWERRETGRVRKPGISGPTQSRFTPSQTLDGARLRGGETNIGEYLTEPSDYGLDRERLSWVEKNVCKKGEEGEERGGADLRRIEPTPHGYKEERRVNCKKSCQDNSLIRVSNSNDRICGNYSGSSTELVKSNQNRNTALSTPGEGEWFVCPCSNSELHNTTVI